MVAALTRSIETGDSNILKGVRVAETTTSWPNVLTGVKLTSTGAEAASTITSRDSNPTELNTRVAGTLETFNLNPPVASVKVPCEPPLTVTETAGTPSCVVAFLTVPESGTDCA